MKIPKDVKIAGHKYLVDICPPGAGTSDPYRGNVNLATHKIWINSEQVQTEREETFFHELIEVINRDNELRLEHNQITILAGNMHAILRNNNLL